MALAERHGEFRGIDDLILLKLSTGLGAGIIWAGSCSAAPSVLRANSDTTRPSRPEASPAAAVTPVASRRLPAVGRWCAACANRVARSGHIRDVVDLANRGDVVARRLIRESGRHVGEAVAPVVNLLNPGVVVVGGDMTGAYDLFVAGLREALYGNASALATRVLRVVPAAFGDRAGVLGTAMMVLDQVLRSETIDALVSPSR